MVRRQGRLRSVCGPLAWFVRSRNIRALQSYLMVLAATSSGDGPAGWSTKHPIRVWARAFGTTALGRITAVTFVKGKRLVAPPPAEAEDGEPPEEDELEPDDDPLAPR